MMLLNAEWKMNLDKKQKNKKRNNMSKELLEIKELYAKAEDKDILTGLNLKINKGEIHVIMGPNRFSFSKTDLHRSAFLI